MWHVDSLYTEKNFNWKIFVLFWTACNFIMLHVFFLLSNKWQSMSMYLSSSRCIFVHFYLEIDLMVDWFYSIRHKNTYKYQNISNLKSCLKISIDYRWRCIVLPSWTNHFFYWHYSVKEKKSFLLWCLSEFSIWFNITNCSLYIFVFFSPTVIILICHSLWCRHHWNK
jgi:hypothetical protein